MSTEHPSVDSEQRPAVPRGRRDRGAARGRRSGEDGVRSRSEKPGRGVRRAEPASRRARHGALARLVRRSRQLLRPRAHAGWVVQSTLCLVDERNGPARILVVARGRRARRRWLSQRERPALARGPWADHRTTVQFTGDTFSAWGALRFEAEYTAAAAAIGLAYVSDDIGGFHADHIEPEELYARWVQFGAFQPALRFHSDHGDRLPWEYGADIEASAEQFLRLREAMLPYNYSLGWEAHTTGMPMARPLWLAFPEQADAYTNNSEYMWGDSLLVAPVTVREPPQPPERVVSAGDLDRPRRCGLARADDRRRPRLLRRHDHTLFDASLRPCRVGCPAPKLCGKRNCGTCDARAARDRRKQRRFHPLRGRGGRF